ncbi:N-(5'-phosphoribosyl)anthranilate isomerase, partial [Pseudomonas sp. MWU12-2534b]
PGGHGNASDGPVFPRQVSNRFILAGGRFAENVAQGIAQVRPYAVDVSGGVEQRKGIKDPAKIQAFMPAVRRSSESM